MKENKVLSDCMELLSALGIYHWRNNTGAYKKDGYYIRYGKVGSSDILGICPDGRFLAVECKRTQGGILSDEQKNFLVSIVKNNGVAIIANSAESLMEELKKNRVI